jgi:hypothetical protein
MLCAQAAGKFAQKHKRTCWRSVATLMDGDALLTDAGVEGGGSSERMPALQLCWPGAGCNDQTSSKPRPAAAAGEARGGSKRMA